MKRLVAAIAIAAFASPAFAQQAPRPQLQQKIAPAGPTMDEVLSAQGTPPPLTGKKRLEVYQRALATPRPLDTGEVGSPVRITPRDLYVNASTYAWVKRGTVAPAEGPTGISNIFPRYNGNQSMLEVHFRAAAGKSYLLDCAIVGGAAQIRLSVGGPAISTVEGHLVAAVPSTAQARDVVLQLNSDRSFQWSSCEIVPVSR
jgi:hypothetical protein